MEKRAGRKPTYAVRLTREDCEELKKVVNKKRTSATIRQRAQIALALDEVRGAGLTRAQVAKALGASAATVTRTARMYSQGGLEELLTIHRSPNSDNARRKVDGDLEARIIRLVCGPAPEGHARWSVRLLAAELAKAEDVGEPVGKDAIARTLKKTSFGPPR